ncbi:MAG: hypothetical protein PHI37_02045 [Candidatus Gracilibacteria bacterium]|nr:hypothetical protein [Candidatus Gracilibacteria bacterium]
MNTRVFNEDVPLELISGEVILESGADLMGDISLNGEGLSDQELIEMDSVGTVYEIVHQNDEKSEENYLKDLEEIFSSSKLENDKKIAVEHIVEQIGRLDNIFGKRNLSVDSLFILNEIERSGLLNVGDSCYFVPGSLSSLRKIIRFGIIDKENIHIRLGKGVNLQEGIRFVKLGKNGYENAILVFQKNEKIDSLSLNIGDNSSMAHSVSFYPYINDNGNYEIRIDSGKNVFFGINSIIGSGSNFGDNTVIWWNTLIGTNVKIGNDCLVGTSCLVENDSVIPDNCLAPNFSTISGETTIFDYEMYQRCKDIIENSENEDEIKLASQYLSKTFIVEYERYIKNPIFYDNELVNEKKSRKFLIIFKSKDDLNNLVENINPDYKGMLNFNSHHVTPENKIFLAITSLLNFLSDNVEGFKKSKEYKFKSTRKLEEVFKTLGGKVSREILKNEIDNESSLNVIPYPKNTQKFLTITFPYIIKLLKNKVDPKEILKLLEEELERPEIDIDKIPDIFLGKCIVTGRCKIIGTNTLLYDTLIRSDEINYSSQKVEINNSALAKVIIHGPGDKEANNVVILNSVFHGETSILNTFSGINIVGDYNHPSTYNNTSIIDSSINTGNITCNNAFIQGTTLGNSISIAGGRNQKVVLKNSTIERKTKIAPGVELNGVEIKINGYYLGRNSVLENKVITPNGIFSK